MVAEVRMGRVPEEALVLIAADAHGLVESSAPGKQWLDTVDFNDILKLCLVGQMDLWAATRGSELEMVMFCSWESHAKRSFYHITFLGARDAHTLKEHLPKGLELVEKYACLRGAKDVVIGGRKGWEKVLEPFGYMQTTIEVRKNVSQLLAN